MDILDPSPRLPMTDGERLAMTVCGAVFLALFVIGFAQDWTPRKWGLLFMIVAWVPLLVIHELGHAFAAWSVGWRVSEIVIGYGREWKIFYWGETRVRLKVVPIEGYVLPSPGDLNGPRRKNAWVYFGGPGAEIVVVLILWWISGGQLFEPSDEIRMIALQGVAASAGLGLFYTLIPLPLGGNVTDGLGMLMSSNLSDDDFQDRLAYPVWHEARRRLIIEESVEAQQLLVDGLKQHPGDDRLRAMQAVAKAQLGDFDAAESLLKSAALAGGSPILDMARAWIFLMQEEVGLGSYSLQAARNAASRAPHDPVVLCIFGWALLEASQPREAYQYLMVAYKQAQMPEEEGMCLALLKVAAENAGPGGANPCIPTDAESRFDGALKRLPLGKVFAEQVARL